MRTGRPCSNTEETFWAGVDKSAGPDACWPWQRNRSPRGYGKTYFRGNDWRAHRLAHFYTTGEKPVAVMHTCDNPPCCNPAHLRAGDNALNSQDRAAKGRGYKPKGAIHHHAKLTDAAVMQIRTEYAAGGIGQRELAQRHGISSVYISQVVRGERWLHLPTVPYEVLRGRRSGCKSKD